MSLALNRWVKAAKSGGNNTGPNCVECLQWSSSACADYRCVQVATAEGADLHAHCADDRCIYPDLPDGSVLIRDSKLGQRSPLLVFTPEQFRDLVASTAAGAGTLVDGQYILSDPNAELALSFTAGEWAAFTDGCRRGEFSLLPV